MVDREDALRETTLIIYGLYLASFIFAITWIIGAVIAYAKRDEAIGTPYRSHLEKLISLFWTTLLLAGIGFILAITVILLPLAWLVGMGMALFFLYRCIKGLIRALDGRPYDD
ncbi:MAG: DUF4870 family protein [Geminicoccaceae bacterium]